MSYEAAASEALLRAGAQAILDDPHVTLDKMPGGASLRRFYRARSGGRSLVAMDLGPDTQKSEEATSGAAVAEPSIVNVQRYLARGGIAVPAIRGWDPAQPSLLYVEDLGDLTLEAALVGATAAEVERLYQAAIDELIKMQGWAHAHPDPECVAFGRRFDAQLLGWELEHFREYGLGAQGIQLDGAESRILDDSFAFIVAELARLPAALVHRDWQSRNLMVQRHDGQTRIRVVDFQDALIGHCLYDLVGLLRDSYVSLPADLLASLVRYFGERAPLAQGLDVPRLFAIQTVQRKLKDSGRFVFIDRVKHNPSFLQHIPASLGYVRAALDQLTDVPQLAALRTVLGRHCFT